MHLVRNESCQIMEGYGRDFASGVLIPPVALIHVVFMIVEGVVVPRGGFAPPTPRSLLLAQDYEFHPIGCSLVP